MLEDRDGSLWVGSAAQGLFHSQGNRFVAVKSPLQPGETLNSLYQDRAGRLWLNGMWRAEKGSFARGVSAEVIPNPLPFVWAMHEDEAGAYWFGTIGGVVRYAKGMTTRFTVQEGLAGNDTKVIIPDTAGGLWLGSYGGLTHYKDGQFKAWTEKDGLPGNTVRTLYQERDGTLWIGTYDSGLGRFKDGRFTRYSVTDGLFDNGIFQIL